MKILAFPRKDVVTGNPYVDLLYGGIEAVGHRVVPFSRARLLLPGTFDAIHFHWPQALLEGRTGATSLLIAWGLWLCLGLHRLFGTRIVWTVHNIVPHDQRQWPLARLFERCFVSRVTHAVFLTEGGRDAALAAYPTLARKSGAIIPHGHYLTAFATRPGPAAPAATFVFGFFGAIRPYKNVPLLIDCFNKASMADSELRISGSLKETNLRTQVESLAAVNPQVKLRLALIPHDEVPASFEGVHLVVLPFTEILNSGSALLALSMGRPILVPRKGAMAELQGMVGDKWVMLFDGTLSPECLRHARDWALSTPRGAQPDLSALDWGRLAKQTITLLET